jgi:hypothetical protein
MGSFGKALVLWALGAAWAAPAAQDNSLNQEEKNHGWKLLFDGKTTAGWRGYKKDKCPDSWQVIDGILTCSKKGGGDIVTLEEFGDFELVAAWRISPGGNSGIMYRVSESEGAPYMTGPEYQLLDNAKHPDGKRAKTSAGSIYDLYEPAKEVCKPAGEWNYTKILVKGTHVEHWLNGEKIVDAEIGSEDWNKRIGMSKWKDAKKYAKETKGHIDLQDHGDKVEFKNIKIHELK